MIIENYLHLYPEVYVQFVSEEDKIKSHGDFRDAFITGLFQNPAGAGLMAHLCCTDHDNVGWEEPLEAMVSEFKPILKRLGSMTDEEAQECLVEVFLVPPHNAWLDVEALKQFLERNVAFTIGVSEEEQGEIPMNMFELTPQTMFNLTYWMVNKHFDIFGLIEAELAVDKATLQQHEHTNGFAGGSVG